ncbi:hypothetical protein [Nostoc sp. CMAA1605]|uniref:hypothetical protein n=1 Tax=Nostoc sp. CMAA1605 TaxID=2055159 RepID=UPI001F246017|nr:hypothetical protein [Nostoc sp. CMAA1605]MCF4966157.1 hypothetical protein [Nostoc sp. CMAA1605]
MNTYHARKWVIQRLENVLDVASKDNSLSSNIRDQLTYLRTNEAYQLTKIANKFRQELQKSNYIHPELERAIRLLEIDIQHYAKFLSVDTLFMYNFDQVCNSTFANLRG